MHEDLIIKEYEPKAACEYAFTMLGVAERRITIPLLAVTLLSLVQSKMIQIGEFFKGVFCLAGQSQSGKTELVKLFFDIERGRSTDTNFDSTPMAIIRIIGNKRDAVVTIDDYKPTAIKSAGNAQMLILDRIIRMCGDDSNGYQKAGQGNSTMANVAQCIVAITAEEVRIKVQSTLARLLIVEMNRQSLNWNALTLCKESHDVYKTFIVNYILYISAQGAHSYCDSLTKRFLHERNTLRNKLLAKGIKADNRTSDQCTWLYISFDVFLNYALEFKAIDQEKFKSYMEESLEIFLNLMEDQAERINELDDVIRFFRGLRYLLDAKEARIERLQARNSSYASEGSKSAIGFSKAGFIYLKNDIAFQAVVSYCRKFAKDFVISETMLRKVLTDSGHLSQNPKNPKTVIHRLSVNRESYQCIKFEESIFNKLLKGDKYDDTGNESELQSDRLLRENASQFVGYSD